MDPSVPGEQSNSVTPPASSRCKVLIFADYYEPGFRGGGPIRSIAQIVRTAPESATINVVTRDRDQDSKVPYAIGSGVWATRGRAEVFYLHTRSLRMWFRLTRWMRREKFDILYVNSLWSPMFAILPVFAARVGWIRTTTVLVAPRGELARSALAISSPKKRIAFPILSRTLRSLEAVMHASTEREAADIRREVPWAKVEISSDPTELPTEPLPPFPPSATTTRLVFISRIARIKTLDLALRALENQSQPIHFDIYGPTEDARYWDECQQIMRSLPPNVRVTYRGTLPPSEVRDTFSRYDAFVIPTKGENFGHAIAESLSASCPVICSAETLWTDVLLDGGGIVVESASLDAWAAAIAKFASMTNDERLAARHQAGTAFRQWRATPADDVNILEILATRADQLAN